MLNTASIKQLADSAAWQKLFFYHRSILGNSSSKVYHQEFFFSPNGKTDPLAELVAYLEMLQKEPSRLVGFVNATAACAFPARYHLVHQTWPDIFPEVSCPQFEKWRELLGLGDVYMVYSSSYPNNPASLFGHTFLRFDRKRKGLSAEGKELLGYSVGFMAVTDPRDNPLLYTLKGVTGQYLGSFQLRPHYVNIGIYNNGESRDLWEYQLNLSEKEREYLEKVLYELVLGPGFSYYFFDDNCSYYLLALLQIIRPDLTFDTMDSLVVMPHETLQEVALKFQAPLTHYRPALSKVVVEGRKKLSDQQLSLLKRGLKTDGAVNDPQVLDQMIEEFKWRNYQEKTKLNAWQKKRMEETLLERTKYPSTLFPIVDGEEVSTPALYAPHLAHGSRRLNVSSTDHTQKVNFSYGLHQRGDRPQGFDPYSYINYLEAELHHQRGNWRWGDLSIIRIESLRPYNIIDHPYSWKVGAGFRHQEFDHGISPNVQGGLGITWEIRLQSLFSIYLLADSTYHLDEALWNNLIGPQLHYTYFTERYSFDLMTSFYRQFGTRTQDYQKQLDITAKYFVSPAWSIQLQSRYRSTLESKIEGAVEFRF